MQNNIFKLNRRYLTATLLALISTGLQAQQASKPRLVISIVINQLTSECLDEYSEALEDGGLKQLLASGKVYSSATMPFPQQTRHRQSQRYTQAPHLIITALLAPLGSTATR